MVSKKRKEKKFVFHKCGLHLLVQPCPLFPLLKIKLKECYHILMSMVWTLSHPAPQILPRMCRDFQFMSAFPPPLSANRDKRVISSGPVSQTYYQTTMSVDITSKTSVRKKDSLSQQVMALVGQVVSKLVSL